MVKKRDKSSDHLETIPGVGKRIAKVLKDIGIDGVKDLKSKSPEKLYGDLCIKYRTTVALTGKMPVISTKLRGTNLN